MAIILWSAVVAIFGAAWSIFQLIRDRERQIAADNRELMNRLFQMNHLVINEPKVSKYLANTAEAEESHFHSKERLTDDDFFRARAFVYIHLNLFDEILALSTRAKLFQFKYKRISYFLGPSPLTDEESWQRYIEHWMQHPMCRAIMEQGDNSFGPSLQEFWRNQRERIVSKAPDHLF